MAREGGEMIRNEVTQIIHDEERETMRIQNQKVRDKVWQETKVLVKILQKLRFTYRDENTTRTQ